MCRINYSSNTIECDKEIGAQFMCTVYALLCRNHQNVVSLVRTNNLINEKLNGILESIPKAPKQNSLDAPQNFKQCTNTPLYFLKPLVSPPNPAYKERPFVIELEILDKKGFSACLPETCVFKLSLVSYDKSPKILTTNTHGDTITRGTTETRAAKLVQFRKVIVKDVSSHFRKGCFCLVISTEDRKDVQPFVLERFVVKARKFKAPEKKFKEDDK